MILTRLLISPEEFGITNYEWTKEGFLNCFQSVSLTNLQLLELPFNFGEIEGNFICSKNKLTSLKGSPIKVNGMFNCSNNELTSLKDGPKFISHSYDCSSNLLTSLEYAPLSVTDFFASQNPLTTYKGIPETITNSFCAKITKMKQIDFFPKNVPNSFVCSLNQFILKMDSKDYVEYIKRFNLNKT